MYLPQGIWENGQGTEEEPLGLSTFREMLEEDEAVKEAEKGGGGGERERKENGTRKVLSEKPWRSFKKGDISSVQGFRKTS